MRMKIAAAILLAVIINASFTQTFAADTKLIVDGTLVNLDSQPVIVNGRLIVPIRAISEGIGATVGWDPGLRQISIYNHDRYVIMRIGDPNMSYGTFHANASGAVAYDSQLIYVLEAPPVIQGGRTLVPLRAIAEGLSAEVRWDQVTSSVYVNSPGATPAPVPASPTPSPAPQADTRYFMEIAGSQAQQWYDAGAPYILFYYSHLSESSMAVLQWVQQTAARENLMVYGVDSDSAAFNNTGGALSFIWDYMDKNSGNTKPALFFVSGKGSVTPLIQPRDVNSIDFCMAAFYYNVSRANPAINGNNLPQFPPPMPPVSLTSNWREVTVEQAIAKYKNNERFIYICYNSRNADCSAQMPMLWLAVDRSKAAVFATDFADVNANMDWFGKDALNGRQIYAYPTIFFVSGSDSIPYGSVSPANILEIMNAFYNFSHS